MLTEGNKNINYMHEQNNIPKDTNSFWNKRRKIVYIAGVYSGVICPLLWFIGFKIHFVNDIYASYYGIGILVQEVACFLIIFAYFILATIHDMKLIPELVKAFKS